MLIKDELFGKEIYATPEEYLKTKGTESAITGIFYIVIVIAFLTFTSVWFTLFFCVSNFNVYSLLYKQRKYRSRLDQMGFRSCFVLPSQ